MDDDDIIIEDNDDAGGDETGFEGEESILETDDEEAAAEDEDNAIDQNPTLTFQVYHGRIRNKFDGLAAMKQAIDKVLYTERFVYPIYSDQYGNDLPDLIGKNINYAKVEVERMITEALEDDDRVTGVDIKEIKEINNDTLAVQGTCYTVYGDVPISKEVSLADES